MTDNKRNLNKKIAAGAILVALSGFVPKVTKPAHAVTATISASGTFSSGLKLTAGNDLNFGIIVATAGSGKMTVNPGGGTATSNAFFNNAAQQDGSILFEAGAAKTVDITVTGMANSLALSSFNSTTAGTVNLPTIKVQGPWNTTGTITFKAATTTASTTLTNTTGDLSIGGVVTWGAAAPVGSFSVPISVAIAY